MENFERKSFKILLYSHIIDRGEAMTYGSIKIKLLTVIQKSGLSKNKVIQRAEMQRTQLNRYCNNENVLIDLDVLARLCTVLKCSVEDILEFVPSDKD